MMVLWNFCLIAFLRENPEREKSPMAFKKQLGHAFLCMESF